MSRKAPTPIRSTPSSAPLETMVAKQQSHIDELVMKNRSLEQTVAKVRSELSTEKARWETQSQQLKQQFKAEQAEWKDGCDALQSLWRIEHLRAVVDLEKERTAALKLREELRVARLARLQRDFQISMFQAKESELEDRIQQLNYELEVRDEEREGEAEVVETLTAQLQTAEEQLELLQEEKQQLERTLSGLRAEHNKALSSSNTESAALERTKLEVDGLKSTLSDLKEKHNDLQRTNSDLLRQLEKWRNMENRDGEELENLRKRNTELEAQVAEHEERATEAAQIETERDKLQVKVQKYKVSLEEHQGALDEANKELDEREIEMGSLRKRVADLEARLKRLSSTSRSPSKLGEASTSKTIFIADEAEDAGSRSPSPPSPKKRIPKIKPKPVTKKKLTNSEDSDVQLLDGSPPPQAEPAFDFGAISATENEVEEVPPPGKGKGKAKATADGAPVKRARGKPKKIQEMPSTETEEVDASDKRKGKRKVSPAAPPDDPPKKRAKKAVVADSESEDDVPAKPPPKKKEPPKPRAKPKAKDPSPAQDNSVGEVSVALKKKKRKINIFTSSDAPPSFDFGLKGASQGGINIPLELSPVKDSDTGLGKALSGLSSKLGR